MIPRCDFCGRFLNNNYYKLVHCKAFFIPTNQGGKRNKENTLSLCSKCNSLRGRFKHPSEIVNFLQQGKGARKSSPEHIKIIIRNITKLLCGDTVKKAKPVITHQKKEKKKVLPSKVKIGVLTQTVGQVGYIKAEPGHPVYEINDRYAIYLKKEHPLTHDIYLVNEIRYYKSSLQNIIKFE